jgi:filamin
LFCFIFTIRFQDGILLRGIVHNLQKKSAEEFQEVIKGKSALELNSEAIDIADKEFKIPALLDAEDVTTNPEELSMMTYLSYFREYEFEHPV